MDCIKQKKKKILKVTEYVSLSFESKLKQSYMNISSLWVDGGFGDFFMFVFVCSFCIMQCLVVFPLD